MYLKRLDVIGFKSFAERIAVDFVPGVTAVVGPNGSGKSNVIDAIRWVLGEQSAKSLRGAKMEDIIFAGSDSRKPLNFAEVTLTLDNEDHFLPIDYSEVSVTRRVYRSGESEYLMNKKTCRLKDIVDLFMDSGLGREAFSIISQGKVEEILNSKAEDRRTIFEEAAGVLKYKSRKKKAEQKLTETEENLNRVQDILHELESQMEPLHIQASLANEFLAQKDELEKIEVALIVSEIEERHEKWDRLSRQLEEHREMEIRSSTSLQTKEAQLEEKRNHIAAIDESVTELQSVLLHASEELEKLEGQKEVLKERKKNAAFHQQQLKNNIQELTEAIADLQTDRKKQAEAVTALEREADELKLNLTTKQEQLGLLREDLEKKIDDLKTDYIELLNQQASARNEFGLVNGQMKQQHYKQEKISSENQKYLQERKLILQKKQQFETELIDVQEKLTAQIDRYHVEQIQLESISHQYENKEKQLYQAYQFLQKAQSRKDMLEEMEDDFSGFFQGVKEVLKARGNTLPGIEGAIAELISVPKELETAIEIALGSAMQHIVVSSEADGRTAIQYLKKNSFGRATFLPLNVIKGRTISNQQLQLLQKHPAYIGVAANLIDFDEKYRDIISNLLGTVIVTKDLKSANEMAKSIQYRFRFVTTAGDIINPGGSMTGGALKQKSTSLLSRKGELEELKEKLVEMEAITKKMEENVKKLKKDRQTQEELLAILRKKGEELRLTEQSCKGRLREWEIEEKNINERLALYDANQQEFAEEDIRLAERQKQLEQEMTLLTEKIGRLNEEIEAVTNQKQTQSDSKEALAAEIQALKVSFAAKNQQYINKKEKLDELTGELEQRRQKLASLQEELALLVAEMSDNSNGEEHLTNKAAEKLQDKESTVSLIAAKRQERFALQESLEHLEVEIKALKRDHKGMSEALKDEEVMLNRLDVELENRLNQLREEFQLSFEGAKEQYPLSLSLEEARKKVKLIKLTIEEMGTVNLGAIEEYDRVSERFTFLTEQKDDLQTAKATLFQVISEMDEEMKKRFGQTFAAIREQFEGVFQVLFGGGRADLQLTEPGDLLNTGVEIVAQPPGKKLQNLGLLSGGERALTAIALLFSILIVRPVPFCILDEVEAALDEANVLRFSQYLHTYSKETQFIVITHRKGTMEAADVLYGITMQESGVSKLVSVRLEEAAEVVN
ncbi:chromosome segregation protein SMC [Bacillaceae bacterium Marseille-Q3522]|nr:chromosome segregation protein SMC [Bacillaceae bacterium Marseille-Q3522]